VVSTREIEIGDRLLRAVTLLALASIAIVAIETISEGDVLTVVLATLLALYVIRNILTVVRNE